MFKLLSKIALLCAVVFLSSCGKDDENESVDSFVEITTDGETKSLTVTKAEYSPIKRAFILKTSTSDTKIMGLTIRASDADAFTSGKHLTSCDVDAELLSPEFIGSTTFTETASVFEITSVDKRENTYIIKGEANEVEMNSPQRTKTLTVDKISFSVAFEVPSTDNLDYLAFEINGVPYTYYSDGASIFRDSYGSPSTDPADANLLLTGNISNDNSYYYSIVEGFSIKILNAEYPPATTSISTYSDGLRVYFTTPEDTDCFMSNHLMYNNTNNSEPDHNSCRFAITNVVSVNDGFQLEGTFSGKITEDINDTVLTIEKGTFKVFVPEI